MNKYLLMSAAVVLAGTGTANAGVHSFTFATSGGGSYCDGGTITTGLAGHHLAAWIHTNNNCASGTSQGAGLLMKVKGLGKVYVLSDNYLAKDDGIDNEYLTYAINKKLTQWTLWIGFSGTSNFEGNSGTLNNVTAGAHGVKSHGTASTAAKVAQLVAAHRR
jgi:hypothetical protein